MRIFSNYLPLLKIISRREGCFKGAQVCIARGLSSLEGTVDRYNGITVDLKSQIEPQMSVEKFHQLLKSSLKKWRDESLAAVWLEVPIQYSRYVDVAATEGFHFHNAENDKCLLKLWLREDADRTPRFATHQLGVCGVVLREDTRQLLVIQERKSAFQFWKFPGGLADLGENIADAAVRETFEETGIRTEFKSVICFRQQHQYPGTFGRSDMYLVCRLNPLTFDITPCDREVLQCTWMSIPELQQNLQITSLTHRICNLVLQGLEHGFEHVDITAERMKSPFKGRHFTLFHRKSINISS